MNMSNSSEETLLSSMRAIEGALRRTHGFLEWLKAFELPQLDPKLEPQREEMIEASLCFASALSEARRSCERALHELRNARE